MFTLLCAFGGKLAIRVREQMIRLLKPWLRKGAWWARP